MPGELEELQAWYASQCDGEWEHRYGVTIGTLDNPGWTVDIDLTDTDLANRPFPKVERLAADHDWIVCEVVDASFRGNGGPAMLEPILRAFLDWTAVAKGEQSPPAV